MNECVFKFTPIPKDLARNLANLMRVRNEPSLNVKRGPVLVPLDKKNDLRAWTAQSLFCDGPIVMFCPSPSCFVLVNRR